MSFIQTLHNISYGSEMLAYFVTILFYMRRKNIVSFLLLLLMSMIFVTETLGKFKSYFPSYQHIFLVQNIEMLIEILIFLAVYYFSIKSKSIKSKIAWMILFYVLFALISISFWQPLKLVFPTYSLVVGGVLILIVTQLYFYEILKEKDGLSLYKNHLFYISIGLFIFYANEMPVMTLLNYLLENNQGFDKIGFIFNLKLIVSILFYGLYSFGLLWTIKK